MGPYGQLIFLCLSGQKHVCVDLTRVVGLRDNELVAGHVVAKIESCKVAKHEKNYLQNQHFFYSMPFDSFGFLAPKVMNFLTKIQRIIHSNVLTPKEHNFVFSKLGFTLENRVTTQFDACFQATLLYILLRLTMYNTSKKIQLSFR